jgi:hypothetical protein
LHSDDSQLDDFDWSSEFTGDDDEAEEIDACNACANSENEACASACDEESKAAEEEEEAAAAADKEREEEMSEI